MADPFPPDGLLDRAGHVFSLAWNLGQTFHDEFRNWGNGLKRVDPTSWGRLRPAFEQYCDAVLELREPMQNPPDGFAPAAECLRNAANVAKQIRDTMQTDDGRLWQSHLEFWPMLNSVGMAGEQAIQRIRKARRTRDPFAFLGERPNPPAVAIAAGHAKPDQRGQYRKNVDALVSKLYVDRPRDLDPELAEVFHAVAVGVRECSRLVGSVPSLWTNEAEYRELAVGVADAATAALTAYRAVDIRLRRAGGPNPVLDTLNDVLKVRQGSPSDLSETPGGLDGVLTRLYSSRAELFPSIDGKGCLDRMLDQLARVPPPSNSAPANAALPPNGTHPGEGEKPVANRSKGTSIADAEILVLDWLTKNAKANPAGITRDAVAAGTGVSKGSVSKTAAWKAFSVRRNAEKAPMAREIRLSDRVNAILPTGNAGKAASEQQYAILDELIRDQEADEAEQERRHERRHKPS